MYPVMKIDQEKLILRPMTCPHHYQLYLSRPRSYKELPFRIAELAKQFRYEKSGELNGLLRVRHLTQDDSHIFLMENQVEKEISTLIKMVKEYYAIFNIEPKFYLSTRPDDFMGEKSDWEQAEKDLESALNDTLDFGNIHNLLPPLPKAGKLPAK